MTKQVSLLVNDQPVELDYFVRSGSGDLWGIVLGPPDAEGIRRTCPLPLQKVKE